MKKIVCKFGGSSVADAAQVGKVVSIVRSDERRCFVVPSAPGKRSDDDTKITDLLYLCHELARQNIDFSEPFNKISTRFLDLSKALGVSIDMERLLAEVEGKIAGGAGRDYVASRGEYLCGRILSDILGAAFVDPAEAILFRSDGRLDSDSYRRLRTHLSDERLYVIPGFYGADAEGEIVTFSR
ncbi:MAG: aspartate kinase, partial [Gemmatimonadota bacterium]|nr:aspartate kinase [Gemmatimonadota bacterium]